MHTFLIQFILLSNKELKYYVYAKLYGIIINQSDFYNINVAQHFIEIHFMHLGNKRLKCYAYARLCVNILIYIWGHAFILFVSSIAFYKDYVIIFIYSIVIFLLYIYFVLFVLFLLVNISNIMHTPG